MENTRRNTAVLAESMLNALPQDVIRKDVEATALLICHLWSSVIRLYVISGKAEAARIIRQYAVMIAAMARNSRASRDSRGVLPAR